MLSQLVFRSTNEREKIFSLFQLNCFYIGNLEAFIIMLDKHHDLLVHVLSRNSCEDVFETCFFTFVILWTIFNNDIMLMQWLSCLVR